MLNAEQIKKLESLAKTIRVDILKMLNQRFLGPYRWLSLYR